MNEIPIDTRGFPMKRKDFLFSTTLVATFFLSVSSLRSEPPAELNDMFVINWDCTDFPVSRTADEMTLEGVRALVDQYAGTKVTHLFFNPNSMRTAFRGRSREAFWDPVDGVETDYPPWTKNLKLLHDRGIDPYKVWIDRCREKGISPWISMRMNDVHNVNDDDSFFHTDFWRKNPRFRRVPDDKAGSWIARAFNYACPEVREHNIEFIRELFERYDFDGFEVDWMRFGYHLTPGKEREEAHFLTGFMKEVRSIAKEWEEKRGHPIRIAARVPAVPEAAVGLGMDALQWAKDGSIDLLIPCPFWTSSDFDIPVEEWQRLLNEDPSGNSAKVALAPGIEHSMSPGPGGPRVPNDLETLYGFVAAERYRGARNFYLFNWMDKSTAPVPPHVYRTVLEKGVGDDVVSRSARRHPICFHDTVPPGVSAGIQLPKQTDKECTFTVPIGWKPVSGRMELIVGLNENQSDAVFTASLNDKTVEPLSDASNGNTWPGVARVIRFDCPPDTARNGTNEIGIRQESGQPQKIVWIELRIEPR